MQNKDARNLPVVANVPRGHAEAFKLGLGAGRLGVPISSCPFYGERRDVWLEAYYLARDSRPVIVRVY